MSCTRAQDSTSSESQNKNTLIQSLTLYHCAPTLLGISFSINTFEDILQIIGLDTINKKRNGVKLSLFSYPSVKTSVLGAQKNCLILSTHNICFGRGIRFLFYNEQYLEACITDEFYLQKIKRP